MLGDWITLGAININRKQGKDLNVTVKYNVNPKMKRKSFIFK